MNLIRVTVSHSPNELKKQTTETPNRKSYQKRQPVLIRGSIKLIKKVFLVNFNYHCYLTQFSFLHFVAGEPKLLVKNCLFWNILSNNLSSFLSKKKQEI